MLKKSEILALLEDFPEEFEADVFRAAVERLALVGSLDAAYLDAQDNGALSLDEFKQGMRACHSKSPLPSSR